MQKVALNTYLEAEQKAQLEEIAAGRGVSQATVVREAIAEYVARRHPRSAVDSGVGWERLLGGYYDGNGQPNDHDDIYDNTCDDSADGVSVVGSNR